MMIPAVDSLFIKGQQEPVTVSRLVDVASRLLLEDRAESPALEYSPFVNFFGPLQVLLKLDVVPIPFETLFDRYINPEVVNYIELIEVKERDCILPAQKFVEYFLRSKVPIPIPALKNSGIKAHGGALGEGRLPFFIHDLFHASQMVKSVMLYQSYLKSIFDSILAVTPEFDKDKVYYILAMYIHEFSPYEVELKGELFMNKDRDFPDRNGDEALLISFSPEEIFNAFFGCIKEKFSKRLSRANNPQEVNWFLDGLLHDSWAYEIALDNCLSLGNFSWDSFIKESQLYRSETRPSIELPLSDDENFGRVNNRVIKTLTREQIPQVDLADPIRDLKALGFIDVNLNFRDSLVVLPGAFIELVNVVEGIARMAILPKSVLEVTVV